HECRVVTASMDARNSWRQRRSLMASALSSAVLAGALMLGSTTTQAYMAAPGSGVVEQAWSGIVHPAKAADPSSTAANYSTTALTFCSYRCQKCSGFYWSGARWNWYQGACVRNAFGGLHCEFANVACYIRWECCPYSPRGR